MVQVSPRPFLAAMMVAAFASPLLAQGKVKVFVLAGQSNMEGKVQNPLYEHQATDDKTKKLFAHLRKGGKWVVRNDVFIKFLGRKGGLTMGYGSRGRTGAELEFGTMMGEHFDEPVVLVKAAWGGHSLNKPFRPPSAGLPDDDALAAELDKATKQVERRNEKRKKGKPAPLPTLAGIKAAYGKSYRNMLAEVRQVLESCGELFPALEGKQPELAGFVWFQGWNDQYNGAEKEYEANMKLFIADVRRDLKAPSLPFVIGVMGQNGTSPAKGAMLAIQEAQLAMNAVPEFRGNVKAVRTDVLVDEAAEKLYPTWRKNLEQWKLTGSDHRYHYLGSAIWFNRIGHAFGTAMLELLEAGETGK